jgi:TRAP-type mannitol/chloroaromatic compound transport system substrate-binding protein
MRTAQEIMKEALETGKITETNQIDDTEIKRLRRIIHERDKMIDELLALLNEMTDKVLANVKEQHQRLVFDIENRTPVD